MPPCFLPNCRGDAVISRERFLMTEPLFTVQALLDATGGKAEGLDPARPINSVSIDSREIGPDALFVAIKGDRFDGHDFVQTALGNGAAAALVSRDAGDKTILVDDALQGLCDIGVAARARSNAFVVGVTGSVGKTTTKEAIRVVLEAAGKTHASIKSFNNHWGVPLMLARFPAEAQYGVFEMGMSAAEEIRPLAKMVRPHVGVITTIAPAHLEAFGSLDGIARAKAELFSGIEPGGTALLNTDHAQIDLLLSEAKAADIANVVTYGEAEGADWRITDVVLHADASTATIVHGAERIALILQVPGRHMLANATAALAVADLAGVDRAVALAALAGFGAQAGRGQRTLFGPAEKPLLLIDESYNANTASMLAALDTFAKQGAPGGRKVVILGDMLELGAQSPQLHASLADSVVSSGAERIYLVGKEMLALGEALGANRVTAHAKTTSELLPLVLNDLAYGDAVMIKGSNGVGLASMVEAIRKTF
jgi:UDP-N-acetylmuramoyl-tripeptide--D-alanyl-D-alanine ligase